MGGDQSKEESQDDYFLLEHLSKFSLNNKKTISYYLIASNKTAIAPLLAHLRHYFKVELFPSVQTLKQEMTFVHRLEVVKIILTEPLPAEDIGYLSSEAKISQLVGYNTKVGSPKDAGTASSPDQLVELLNKLEEKDPLQIPPTNVLFLIDQDTKSLNKYRLSYHCNTKYSNRQTAKNDFLTLAKKICPEQSAAIQEFQQSYDLTLKGEEKRKMVLQWAFKDGFYWDLVNTLSRNSTDPKRLAYVRLPLKDIYESVAEQFRSNKIYQKFWIIVYLTKEEESKIQKSENNFLLFTSFVKGIFNQKKASNVWKEKKKQAKEKGGDSPFLFTVNMYNTERDNKLDFGFVRGTSEPYDAILNIYNVLRIEQVLVRNKTGELRYGDLPVYEKIRQTEEARDRMTKMELDLTRNYDFLEDLMNKVDGQATLLQMSGYYKDSLQIYDKKVDFIRKSNESEQTMNRCLIRKADALALSGDPQLAELQYQAVTSGSKKMKAISLIHLADLYLRLGEETKLDKTINELQPLLPVLENEEKEKEQYFKGKHYLAIKALKNGSLKKAETMLGELVTSVSKAYLYTLEGKPLIHDIYRTQATVQSKLGRHEAALKTLNSTLQLQLVCEGKTHNVALTETLIQSVCRTSGNKEELTKSMQRLEGMSTDIESNQRRLASSAVANLNQSMVNLDV